MGFDWGFDCGFDMVPSLTTSEADATRWLAFLDEIKAIYYDDPVLVVTLKVIEFHVGERPGLPVEGHKFLCFGSKVSGNLTQAAEPYIRKVHRVARQHFGSQVRFWHEAFDDYGHYEPEQVIASTRSYQDSVSISSSPAARSVKADRLKEQVAPAVADTIGNAEAQQITETAHPEATEGKVVNSWCRMQSIPGKGQALVAAQTISKGCRILTDAPLLTFPRQGSDSATSLMVAAKLRLVSKDQQRAFFGLHNNHGGSLPPFLGIAKTNALPLGPQATEGGIFLLTSRINHACLPNCQHSWNSSRGEITVHAVRDIEQGEELTIIYCDTLPSKQRRAELQNHFGFECACKVCSLPKDELQRNDERLKEIRQLDEMIGDGMHLMQQPREHLRWIRSLLSLLETEGISDARLSKAYYDAFQTVIAHRDQARAKVFAERSYETRLYCEGEDGDATRLMKEMAADPKSHRLFGTSSKWAQGINKIPKGLESDDFEKWLWRPKV